MERKLEKILVGACTLGIITSGYFIYKIIEHNRKLHEDAVIELIVPNQNYFPDKNNPKVYKV